MNTYTIDEIFYSEQTKHGLPDEIQKDISHKLQDSFRLHKESKILLAQASR